MARVCLRDLTAEEHAAVTKLAHSRSAPAQVVQRAQILWRASRGEAASAMLQHGRVQRSQGSASVGSPAHLHA